MPKQICSSCGRSFKAVKFLQHPCTKNKSVQADCKALRAKVIKEKVIDQETISIVPVTPQETYGLSGEGSTSSDCREAVDSSTPQGQPRGGMIQVAGLSMEKPELGGHYQRSEGLEYGNHISTGRSQDGTLQLDLNTTPRPAETPYNVASEQWTPRASQQAELPP
ncbi:hypothetical protein PG987_004250 [Apiospora arundinis]